MVNALAIRLAWRLMLIILLVEEVNKSISFVQPQEPLNQCVDWKEKTLNHSEKLWTIPKIISRSKINESDSLRVTMFCSGRNQTRQSSYSYPFDWLWCPSKTTFDILSLLIHNGIESAVEYMTTGYTYYRYLGNEHYISVKDGVTTECQMNKHTG